MRDGRCGSNSDKILEITALDWRTWTVDGLISCAGGLEFPCEALCRNMIFYEVGWLALDVLIERSFRDISDKFVVKSVIWLAKRGGWWWGVCGEILYPSLCMLIVVKKIRIKKYCLTSFYDDIGKRVMLWI